MTAKSRRHQSGSPKHRPVLVRASIYHVGCRFVCRLCLNDWTFSDQFKAMEYVQLHGEAHAGSYV